MASKEATRIPELLEAIKRLLQRGRPLEGARFPRALFETVVVAAELARIHQTQAPPERGGLFDDCIARLALPASLEKLATLAELAAPDDPAAELCASLLRSNVPARGNPILKLIFAAQYEELLDARQLPN